MRVSIYQINRELAADLNKYAALEDGKIILDSSAFERRFSANVDWEGPLEISNKMMFGFHPLFRSNYCESIDVVVIDGKASACYDFTCYDTNFDEIKARVVDNPYRVVYVEPGKPAYEAELGSDIQWLQKAVGGGLIECVYAHNDQTLIVGNDEAKLIGMEGNRWVGRGILMAGPFFVIGQEGENFRSLTDEEVNKYVQMYAEPQQIPQREVQNDIRYTFFSF